MNQLQIVLDTNVIYSALRSKRGASYKLLSLLDSHKFEINLSVPLVIEYEDVFKRKKDSLTFSETKIDQNASNIHWYFQVTVLKNLSIIYVSLVICMKYISSGVLF